MQVIYLTDSQTFFMDILAWLLIHLTIGFSVSRIPVNWFNPKHWLYQTYSWEKRGEFYQKWFKVRAWKKYIPSGGSLYPDTFSLQQIKQVNLDYLERWLKECCRAEFCHWLMILPGFLFFLWNSIQIAWLMVFYAFLNNFFPIVLQRFNRPRIRNLIEYARKHPGLLQSAGENREQKEAYSHSYC